MTDSKTTSHDRDALMAAVAGKYPAATPMIDGRAVGEKMANVGSVNATLDDYAVLDGVREVPMVAFDQLSGQVTFVGAAERDRTMALAEAIRQSGRIDPLIVVEDAEGPYVLEGSHRFDALRLLGACSFPAKVVLDMAALLESGVHALPGDGQPVTSPVDEAVDRPAQDFDRWFGTSQLVDPDGKPLKLFHGSNRVFDALAPSGSGNMGSGYYLTTSAHASGVFGYRASLRDESSGPVSMPFYVRAERLLNTDVLKARDIENLRRAIPRTPDGLAAYGVEVETGDVPFWQEDLDKLHAALDRGHFSPVRLSGMILGTGREVEVLGRIYAAAGYDAIGRTSDAFKTEANFYEVLVYDPGQLKFAISTLADCGDRHPTQAPCTYYGTIEAKESDRTLLQAMGVEVWRYDHDRGRFYVCYEPAVHDALQEHTSDFLVRTTAVPRVAELTVFHADQEAPVWLPERQAYLEWQVMRQGVTYTAGHDVERAAIADALRTPEHGTTIAVPGKDHHPSIG